MSSNMYCQVYSEYGRYVGYRQTVTAEPAPVEPVCEYCNGSRESQKYDPAAKIMVTTPDSCSYCNKNNTVNEITCDTYWLCWLDDLRNWSFNNGVCSEFVPQYFEVNLEEKLDMVKNPYFGFTSEWWPSQESPALVAQIRENAEVSSEYTTLYKEMSPQKSVIEGYLNDVIVDSSSISAKYVAFDNSALDMVSWSEEALAAAASTAYAVACASIASACDMVNLTTIDTPTSVQEPLVASICASIASVWVPSTAHVVTCTYCNDSKETQEWNGKMMVTIPDSCTRCTDLGLGPVHGQKFWDDFNSVVYGEICHHTGPLFVTIL